MTASRARLAGCVCVGLLLLGFLACAREKGSPEEFPPIRLGMTVSQVRRAVLRRGTRVLEEGERMLRVVGRDRRVAEEVFLFHNDRLAAWTLRYATPATRGNLSRLTRRFSLAYGDPIERIDDGQVVSARWKMPEGEGRVLLSGYIGGRDKRAPLMVRVEDPSVIKRLIRDLRAEAARQDTTRAR